MIERMRSQEKISLTVHQQSALLEIQRAVAVAHDDIDSVMEAVVQGAMQVINGIDGAVIEIQEGAEMVYRAGSGSMARHVGMRLAVEGSLSGLCVKEGRLLYCPDSETDPRVNREACRALGVRSMVVAPIPYRGMHIGVLKVFSAQPDAFMAHDQLMAQFFVNAIAAGFGSVSEAKALENLRASEETFRSAMQHASIGMALVAPDGRFLQVNRSLCELIGYSEKALLGLTFQQITYPDDLDGDMEMLRELLGGKISSYQLEKRYVHQNGNIVWILLNVSLVRNADGSPKNFIAQIQDICERKKMEQMKAEFIATVSHELRTPLTAIHTSLGLIAKGKLGQLPAEAVRAVDIAYRNSERLKYIINDILDIERIESGKLSLNASTVEVSSFVQQVLDINQGYGDKYHVRFVVSHLPDQLYVRADSARLMQVMTNLLSNAAKFSHFDSEVRIAVEAGKEMVCFSVQDAGVGIPEAFHNRIFDKFAQADSSDKRKHDGTGLGLHITRKLVQAMHGTITFESAAGEGTIFYVFMPRAWVEAKPANPSLRHA